MAEDEENSSDIDEKLEKSYLHVIQTLQFSKENKSDEEVAAIQRGVMFTKYVMFKNSINDEAAATVLAEELEKYSDLVDDKNGINNYWKQFSSLNLNIDNDPQEWKSSLTDPNIAVELFKQTYPDPPPARGTQEDLDNLMKLWKNEGSSPRKRKIPHSSSTSDQSSMDVDEESQEDQLFSNSVRRPLLQPRRETIRKEETETSVRPGPSNINKPNVLHNRNEKVSLEKKEEKPQESKFSGFKTARTVLGVQQAKNSNRQTHGNNRPQAVNNRPPMKRSLGGRALNSPYVCPFKDESPKEEEQPELTDERFKNIEPKMIELIKAEIMDHGSPVSWDDIAGLELAKRIIKEIVVFPMLRPDIFTGLRRPPKGILLFGPPGTGKTLIGKCIASQSKSTFFSISASSLTSKWVGEGEKMVRALFAVARVEQPSVVFIDEIDSLLCQRSETEHESSRRMKTEFLVQLDGAATGDEDRILVIGATNRPYELDEAARRRLVKRLYIPLPELEARAQIVKNLLKLERNELSADDIYKVAELSDGYSGADMTNLCKEASMGPIRSIPFDQLEEISKDDVRKVTFQDFKDALEAVRPSVSPKDLSVYIEWDRTYGTASAQARA